MKLSVKQQQEGVRRNEVKWGKPLLAAGWSMLPNVFLERQRALGLDAIDVNILLHLVRHWWFSENLPHPSKKTIAECMSINVSTVRKRIAKMEAAGYIKRRARFDKGRGQQTNEYDLGGLIKEALPFAEEMLETRRKRKTEDANRRRRTQPTLTVVERT